MATEDDVWHSDKESEEYHEQRRRDTSRNRLLLLSLVVILLLVVVITVVSATLIYLYDLPFRRTPDVSEKPCDKIFCTFGAQCLIERKTQKAFCHCKEEVCSSAVSPVCGSDGTTYSSLCHLKSVSCIQQRTLTLRYMGHCDSRDPCGEKDCPFGARCRPSMDGRTAECVCPDKCATYGDSRGSRPVCGTDGRDYPNVCELRRTSCKEMREIQIKFQGRCDPCEGVECPTSQVCQLDDSRNPICRCNSICTPDLRPVCGSDGKTYTNECTLRVEACRSRKIIRIIYTGECSAGANPCETLDCGPSEHCDIDRYGIATCECQPSCEPVMRPVCGSDGRTYHNDCELQRMSCLSRREVMLLYRGECGERGPCHKHECSFGSVCVIKGGYAVCECPSCTEEFEPVCGTNGISYTNVCKLKREACEQKVLVDVAYEGLCNGCENKLCEFYAACESDGEHEARCVCPHSCIKVESTVCGTDGVTYLNECEMRLAACNKKQYVVVGSRGPCDLCQNVHCKYGARCENGRCICPTECPDHFEAVCASDGSTYRNECEMRKSTCMRNQELSVLFYGECGDVGSSGQELRSVGEGCREKMCNFGAICEYDAEGVPMCVCNFECPLEREPVCGSDGILHSNGCRLKEETCRQQTQLYILPAAMCEDTKDVPCDGEMPLIDPLTSSDYFCGDGPNSKRCPPSSYCHKTETFSKCCREIASIKTCADSTYGCCPDGKTSALGKNFAGCPSWCNCNRLGSYGLTCDADSMQCSCKPGVGGLRCDRCEPGYWGLHRASEGSSGCSSCNCNQYGSVRDDCEQMSGRCVCREGITGTKCDACILPGMVLGEDGCTDVSISKAIAGSCADLSCLHGAVCKQKEDGDNPQAQCVCEFRCTAPEEEDDARAATVCGSDGNTYGSECQLRLFSCRYQQLITVASNGPCKRGGGQTADGVPTPGPVRRSTIQRTAAADHSEMKSTREIAFGKPETFQLTTRPTLATPIATDHFVQTPSFFGRSYLELPRLQAYTRLSLELEFQTFTEDGILLYNGQTPTGTGDFVSLAIKDGFVEFRFNLGNGPVVLRSPQKLHLGKYHRLVAKRYLREGLLTLDGQDNVAGRSQGSLKSLDLTENLFLGYVPTERKGVFENIAVNTGMVGCIRRLKIGKKEIDLRFPASKDIIRGRGIRECGKSPCSSMPCQNRGICEPGDGNDYRCTCSIGFSGKFCETTRNPCANSSCSEGSTCITHERHGFICICPPEKTGKFCEKAILEVEEIFIPEFERESYLEFPTLTNVRHAFTIEVWFLSRSPEGTLLYNGQKKTGKGDFVAITLTEGHIVFRFDLGSTKPTISGVVSLKSEQPVTLNEWHTVKVNRLWKNGTLQVDDGRVISSESSASLTELNLEQPLYVGGVRSLDVVNPEAEVKSGLNGAIQKIVINGDVWEDMLSLATWSHAVRRYRGPPCGGPGFHSSFQCLNGGICSPRLNLATCRCPLPYWGSHCEKKVTKEDLERPVAFDGHRFLSLSNKRALTSEGQRESNIEITFRTDRAWGLLLWTHGGASLKGADFLSLALVEGHVQLSFNLGKQSEHPLLLTSQNRVDDLQWHTALVERNMRLGSLTVDNNPPVSNTSEPGATELNTDGIFWIGGCPNLPMGMPSSYYDGFKGCIERVVVDGDPLHLALTELHGDITFCDAS